MKLPSEQQAIRNKCFHPSGMFVEFAEDAMEHSIPESFEKIVRMYPDRVAVKTTNLLLTYTELNRAADQVGCAILAQCGDEKEPVAVCLGHGADVIIAVLAYGRPERSSCRSTLHCHTPETKQFSMLRKRA